MERVMRGPASFLACLLILAACGGRAPDQAFPPGDGEPDYAVVELAAVEPPPTPEEPGAIVAEATVPSIRIFRQPGDGRPWTSIPAPGPFEPARVFLVEEERGDWLRVLLPMEPNGSEGWIRTRDVRRSEHPFRVEVDLGDRKLTAYRSDRVVLQAPVAVGTPATPTPTGRFFTTLLAKPDDPTGPYGSFAYGLSAYSEVLETFAGGDGQVAIHGTNAPWLIGQAVSHGCIRVHNSAIRRLARLLPLGTPVRVTA
jgi:lipoprotein-anchoring transpeptidase ErfK/SrfK